MGRQSKLSDKQWAQIEDRILKGDAGRVLAREFGVSEAAIRKRFGTQHKQIKDVANQLVTAEIAFESLPLGSQVRTRTLADELKSISTHLAGAARFGSATAHRLAGIANAKVQEIDDAAPMDDASMDTLKGIAVLTRMANDASVIGVNLINANKDTVKEINSAKPEQVGRLDTAKLSTTAMRELLAARG